MHKVYSNVDRSIKFHHIVYWAVFIGIIHTLSINKSLAISKSITPYLSSLSSLLNNTVYVSLELFSQRNRWQITHRYVLLMYSAAVVVKYDTNKKRMLNDRWSNSCFTLVLNLQTERCRQVVPGADSSTYSMANSHPLCTRVRVILYVHSHTSMDE